MKSQSPRRRKQAEQVRRVGMEGSSLAQPKRARMNADSSITLGAGGVKARAKGSVVSWGSWTRWVAVRIFKKSMKSLG